MKKAKFYAMILVLLGLSSTVVAQGPVELEILDPTPRVQDSNFRLANITGFSVSYELPGRYRLFGTTTTQRIRWNGDYTGFEDMYFSTSLCSETANPGLDWDSRCIDAIGLFSKNIDCDLGDPCEWGGKWNASPGTLNMSVHPVSWLWPNSSSQPFGSPNFTPILNIDSVNTVTLNPSSNCVQSQGTCPPKSGIESTCSPNNLDAWATGVANAKAVQVYYAGGVSRWFMAFNKQINQTGTSSDHWRVLWASSDDGVTWSVDEDILFRSIKEASGWCGHGFLVTDMFLDSGHFYMTFTDVATKYVYLVRSRIDSYGSDPGYVNTWSVASYPVVNGNWTWQALNLGQQLDLPAMGAANIFPNPLGGDQVVKVRQSDIGRIFDSPVAYSANQYVGLASDIVGGVPVLQVFSTGSLEKPFSYQSQVDLSPVAIGGNGLEFAFTQYHDNLPGSPRLINDQLDFWIIQNQEVPEDPYRRLTASRKTAKVTGGIFGP